MSMDKQDSHNQSSHGEANAIQQLATAAMNPPAQEDSLSIEDIKADDIDAKLACSVPYAVANKAQFLPVAEDDQYIDVLITPQTDPYIFDEYRLNAEKPIRPRPTSEEHLLSLLGDVYQRIDQTRAEEILEDIPLSVLAASLAHKPDLLEAADNAPIIQLVNNIIVHAKKDRASDIHLEPYENDIVVRYRIDGILHEALRPPKPIQAPLMSRIKVMAGLNIAESRLPQDGAMVVQIGGKDIDVRVSSLPTTHGERLVLRLLEKNDQLTQLSALGLTPPQESWLKKRIESPHGIVLVTGPTGSGKSTTLYSALLELNSTEKNIITIEDPVEYSLPGVGQIQVSSKIGLTFAGGLRSILRQDPDVIMLGEIRDLETAEIAIQASLTGHLVLSTLHTNDSVGAIVRLADMGIEPFLLSSSLVGVMAQRLVRRLCPDCKKIVSLDEGVLAKSPLNDNEIIDAKFYHPEGCEKCLHTGYRGRVAIYEMLTISERIQHMINTQAGSTEIRASAARDGLQSLEYSGWKMAAKGVTSVEDVIRVIHSL